ncbi:MAG: NADH-quinone oxidoreductase subunit G [Alphaproteobacteria bacterium]|nr:MAG: NADH-quinone oxidoreductase subunit G [Alphaproteobacteria bacterium]
MPKITINDMEIEVEAGTSILQAAEQLGIEIPRFCYHDKLSVPANCRMCLVEVEGGPPKPAASCAIACGDGMVVHTESEMVKKARKGVMEMLLINHPLDCPICDQGGECDLQDQAVSYGFDRSRYHEDKRTVSNKDLGPLIGTEMTRCINCTRCVRFAEEIAGTPVLGQFNRGEDSEIGTFIGEIVDTELSGNLVDICPVGALTSKPYAYSARSWELTKTETIDVHDSLGCNIRVDSRGREVMRILPRLNEDINEEWIDDRARFSCDGLAAGRIDRPYIRDEESGKLVEAEWSEAFVYIKKKLSGVKGDKIAALAGDLVDVEAMVAMKDLMNALGSPNMDCRTDSGVFNTDNRASYLFNSTIAGIDEADAILLVGVDPRHEATMINARIRKNWLEKKIPISLIGEAVDLTYPYEHMGTGPKDLEKLVKQYAGKVKAKKPMMIVGSGVFRRDDGMAIHALLHEAAEALGIVKKNWNGFNILHGAASRVGGLEVGFLPQKNGLNFSEIISGTKDGSIEALFLLGADEFNARVHIGWKTFVVYQGHHGDHAAERADVILPAAAYTEKDGLYVNTEGRPQLAKRAVTPPGDAKEDWAILRAMSEHICRKPLPYNSQLELRTRIQKEWPIFKKINEVAPAKWVKPSMKGRILKDSFILPVPNYYLNNPICRASKTMKTCTEAFTNQNDFQEAAE